MYIEALSIAVQTACLSIYFMQANPFANILYLMGAYGLSQLHLAHSVIRATNGFKFEFFSKLLISQLTVGMVLIAITYGYFSKIQESKDIEETGLDRRGAGDAHEGLLLAKGYKRFLEEFKEKKISVVKGEAINQIIAEELK